MFIWMFTEQIYIHTIPICIAYSFVNNGSHMAAGDAIINGLSIKSDMTAIRQDLGVCPQFDILWPEITVKEHLMLYAAIKGFTRLQQLAEATTAAHDVGKSPRLLCFPKMTCGGSLWGAVPPGVFALNPQVKITDLNR